MKEQTTDEKVKSGDKEATRFMVLVVVLLVTCVISIAFIASKAQAAEIEITVEGGENRSFDLVDPVARGEFIELLSNNRAIKSCINKADYAVQFMKERDEGVTKEGHLQNVRDQYEQTKLEPQGAVPWHVYIDFERLVRDVHRSAGANAKGEYRNTDPNILWDHEFRGCAVG